MNKDIPTEYQAVGSEQDHSFGVINESLQQDNSEVGKNLDDERRGIENTTLKHNQVIRIILIVILLAVSIGWLCFTGHIVYRITFWESHLTDVVATAFITTPLATVFRSWAIGLRYFFSTKN